MNLTGRFPTRLLIDLPTWIGDQVMALPAVRVLVDGNRGGDTVLHTTPAMRRLLELLFPEARVAAARRKTSPFVSARALCGPGGRFELGVTLRNALRAKILVRLAARSSVGSRGEGAMLLLSQRCVVDRARHQVFDADTILRALGLPGVDAAWRPRTPRSLVREGRRALERAGVMEGGQVVGLAPATARAQARRWPADRFGHLARHLTERGLLPVVVVGPGEEGLAEAVRRTATEDLPVVGPDLDVAALAGVLSGLDAVVANDSGPMHLAALCGTQVVGLFGPSDPRRTAPLGRGHQVLNRHLVCSPCTAHRCPLGHHECLRSISVDEVDAALTKILVAKGSGIDHSPVATLVSN
jgi:heptosyltransferase-2